MNPNRLAYYAEVFRSAVEASDFALAQAALQKYAACFWAESRTLPDTETAIRLLQWGIAGMQAQKTQITQELLRLQRVRETYCHPKSNHTWGLQG